jgi:hypothetical protein
VEPKHMEYQALKGELADQYAKATLDNLNLSARITRHLVDMPDEMLADIAPVNLAVIKRAADVGSGIAHEHYRLESGQATQITDVRGAHVLLTSQIDELRKMLCNQSEDEDCTHNDYRDAQVIDIVDDNGQ